MGPVRCPPQHSPIMRGARSGRRRRFVLLGLWPISVSIIDITDRAFAHECTRQNHRANEPGLAIGGGLRENRMRSGLEPGAARAVRGRLTRGIDADSAFDQATDARTLMRMQERAATGRESDAVAAQQQIAVRHGVERGGQLLAACDALRFRPLRPRFRRGTRQFEAPTCRAVLARLDCRPALAVPGLAIGQCAPLDDDRSVHDKNHTGARRGKAERRTARNHIFEQGQCRLHSVFGE